MSLEKFSFGLFSVHSYNNAGLYKISSTDVSRNCHFFSQLIFHIKLQKSKLCFCFIKVVCLTYLFLVVNGEMHGVGKVPMPRVILVAVDAEGLEQRFVFALRSELIVTDTTIPVETGKAAGNIVQRI